MEDDATSIRNAGADAEQQYRAIFEATSDGLVINDPETGLVLEANPAFCRMHGYDQMVGMHPAQFTHPDSHYLFEEYKRAAAAGRELRWRCRHSRRDDSTFDVEVIGRAFTYGGKPAMLGVVRDVSEQVRGEELLEERVQERTRELSTLLHVSRSVTATLDLEALLKVILEQVRVVADYDRASFHMLEGGTLEIRSICWTGDGAAGRPQGARTDLAATPGLWQLAQSGEPIIIADVNDGSDLSQEYRRAGGAAEGGIRSWMGIPLMSRGKTTGLLALAKSEPGFFTELQARLARAFADQASIAIDNARLFEEAARRARETTALLEVSRVVASSLDLTGVFGAVLDQLGAITEHTGSSILLTKDDAFEFVEARSRTGARAQMGTRIPFAIGIPLVDAMRRGETVIIDDVRANEPLAADYRAAIQSIGMLDQLPFNVIRSWMSVPLALKDRVLGALTMSWTEPNHFTADHARLARAFADQASIAIENARAYQDAEERTRELATLLAVSQNVASTLDLQALLRVILEQVGVIAEYDRTSFSFLEGDEFIVQAVDWVQGRREWLPEGLRIRVNRASKLWNLLNSAEPVIIGDISGDSELARQYRQALGTAGSGARSWIGAPLISRGRTIGLLSLVKFSPDFFTERHARLARAIADQATIAIENARLYEQAQRLAATEERQRLARELHDSVSQAIYGIALGARTARALQDRNPTEAVEPMEYVISLAEAALAEMRALIFELRPESLANEGLVAAINKRVEATAMRYGIGVDWDPPEEPDVALTAKEAVYRVVQEALHNIVKHSKATRATVMLKADTEVLSFRISDDGIGFDPAQSFAGHLGLQSMRERVQRLGGVLQIESEANSGTSISGSIPLT